MKSFCFFFQKEALPSCSNRLSDPFLSVVVGFLLLSYALLAADLVVPGAHWQVAAALAVLGLPALFRRFSIHWRSAVLLAGLSVAFTLAWCADVPPRLARFHATGGFPFWVDFFVHAGTLAEFGSPEAIGRGPLELADTPLLLYHFASYMPAALVSRLCGLQVLDAALLVWLPLGIFVMASGIAALGLALGGPWLAAMGLAALALMPDPSRFSIGDGFLSFAFLIEASPGTSYSIGVACAALAMLMRWFRDQRPAHVVFAILITAACSFVRANTFVWLAPTTGLALAAGWQRFQPIGRLVPCVLALAGFIGLLVGLSWPSMRIDPAEFMYRYVEFIGTTAMRPAYAWIYPDLLARLGRTGAACAGLGLILLNTLGPWLPAFLVMGSIALWRRRLEAVDILPLLLLVVACIMMLLAPVAQNLDVTEYRHRAGPLLVVVTAIWTLRFSVLALPRVRVGRRSAIAMTLACIASIGVLAETVGAAKRPRMPLTSVMYDMQLPPGLIAIASFLERGPAPRFAVANEPPDARIMDDATMLAALSGTPAYIARPAYLHALGGATWREAERRLDVLAKLRQAGSLEALQKIMQAEALTYYVVTEPEQASFDPAREGAIGHAGTYAVYGAEHR